VMRQAAEGARVQPCAATVGRSQVPLAGAQSHMPIVVLRTRIAVAPEGLYYG
jgi:hypothetical protein